MSSRTGCVAVTAPPLSVRLRGTLRRTGPAPAGPAPKGRPDGSGRQPAWVMFMLVRNHQWCRHRAGDRCDRSRHVDHRVRDLHRLSDAASPAGGADRPLAPSDRADPEARREALPVPGARRLVRRRRGPRPRPRADEGAARVRQGRRAVSAPRAASRAWSTPTAPTSARTSASAARSKATASAARSTAGATTASRGSAPRSRTATPSTSRRRPRSVRTPRSSATR